MGLRLRSGSQGLPDDSHNNHNHNNNHNNSHNSSSNNNNHNNTSLFDNNDIDGNDIDNDDDNNDEDNEDSSILRIEPGTLVKVLGLRKKKWRSAVVKRQHRSAVGLYKVMYRDGSVEAHVSNDRIAVRPPLSPLHPFTPS